MRGLLNSPENGDLWLGTLVLDTWFPWNRHVAANGLFLDGHVKSMNKSGA